MIERRWGVLVVLAFGLLLTGCLWVPSVRYDGGNTGYNRDDTTLTAAGVDAATVRFRASLGFAGSYAGITPLTPVVAGGHVLGVAQGRVVAYDAAGVDQCSGVPVSCQPQWIGDFGHPWVSYFGADVAGDTVFVTAGDLDVQGALMAFDLNGVTNCSGSPRVCQPLWTASVRNANAPTVVNGKVYQFDPQVLGVKVFDAAGQQGCSGTPTVCSPLWTSPVRDVESGPVRLAVSGGSVYVAGSRGGLAVSDAEGVQGCTGAPKVCEPMWTVPNTLVPDMNRPSPVVDGGRVFVVQAMPDPQYSEVAAYDAAGVANCSGSPRTCSPLWHTPVGITRRWPSVSLAVANGRLYVPNPESDRTDVYDTSGSGCAGSPMVCPSLFTFGAATSVTVDNGLAVQAGANGVLAYDATGVTGCSSGLCSPVAQNAIGTFRGFVIADGRTYGYAVDGAGNATITGAW